MNKQEKLRLSKISAYISYILSWSLSLRISIQGEHYQRKRAVRTISELSWLSWEAYGGVPEYWKTAIIEPIF